MKRATRRWLGALMILFGRNWITLFGGVLSGTSGLLIVGFLILGLMQLGASPYLGIMAFLILPAVFVLGLLIVPVGAYWERRKARKRGSTGIERGDQQYPVIDFNVPYVRHVAVVVIVLTAFNLLLISTVAYQGVAFMDSVTFCGRVCHTVMEPEYTAYLNSAHSRVRCVECHIGPGAPWFVRSKISGTGQVLAVTFNTYDRPIPTPVENLRPSQDTCEQCHWPQKFTGNRVRVIRKFQADEKNTPVWTVLLIHIGGSGAHGTGIHSWHIDPGKRTFYVTADPKRQEILRVRVEKSDGSVMHFTRADTDAGGAAPKHLEERLMDCIDCHNRPTHVFMTPEKAMDDALANGRIDSTLPYIKKVGTEALTEARGAQGDLDQISQRIRTYYESKYADVYAGKREAIEGAVDAIQDIYSRNVFANMNVTWSTYPDNIGHESFPGCFRCHDDSLSSENGEAIGQDCEICHKILAWDEENPAVLEQLRLQ